MAGTKIEWADAVWNPVTGCTPCSPGCDHCYAKRMSVRLAGRCGYPPSPRQFDVTLHQDVLEQPMHWRKPKRIFVCSMADLFHPDVPDAFLDRVFAMMLASHVLTNHRHQDLVLTKRPERMRQYLIFREPDRLLQDWAEAGDRFIHLDNEDVLFSESVGAMCSARWSASGIAETQPRPWSVPENCWPLPNVWLGVTAENQEMADARIPILLQTPAAVRFVSVEPMLGPVDLHIGESLGEDDSAVGWTRCVNGGRNHQHPLHERRCLSGIDWVICGGETGPGARPMHPDWARSLRDQCQAAKVPFFFKQWGEWAPAAVPLVGMVGGPRQELIAPDGTFGPAHDSVIVARIGKKTAGRRLDGREWNEFPEEGKRQ